VALAGSVLPAELAGPALAEAKAVDEHVDRLATAGRAHQFPRAISFSPSISSAWLATIRFKRTFSRSAPSTASHRSYRLVPVRVTIAMSSLTATLARAAERRIGTCPTSSCPLVM